MNQVFVCGTYFHVYVSLLKSIYREDKTRKTLLVINDRTPGVERILPSLQLSGYFDQIVQVPFIRILRTINKEEGLFSRWFFRNKNYLNYVESNSNILEFHPFIKESEINIFSSLGLSPAYFLLKYKENYFRMIEDGEANYVERVNWFQAFKRKYILNTFVGEGMDEAVREIEVQWPDKLPARVRSKGKTLEFVKMVSELDETNRKKIVSIFMSEFDVKVSNKRKLLLITQPLSEDNFMAEADKIGMYNTILNYYAADFELYLKPHPRELTDYQIKTDKLVTFIPRDFPLEMINVLGNIKFDLGVTISSSSLNNINCVERKIILGRKYFTQKLPVDWYNQISG